MGGKKIKVLVVDDSLVFREVITRGISSDPYIEVVAKAVDPFDARDKILEFEPDVMTCDVEMPKMNGIEFIRRLLPQYTLPVIVVSTVSDAVFDAMNAGAVDFVTKPHVQSPQSVERFINDLIVKIKIASQAKVTQSNIALGRNIYSSSTMDTRKIIAIGSSTGGTEAVYSILKCLPSTIPGIVIVQHIPPVFSGMFAERLNNQIQLTVKEAQTGDYVEQGKVLIAPGDQHMRIKKIGDRYKVEVFKEDKVNGHCPSVDVLFESVAKEAGSNAIGIILTGMGYDGARGLLSMKRKGARTIGQDEQSSVIYGMPKVAYEIGAVEKKASLLNIPQVLISMLR
ncbi:chemotaxis response regulator protein-glutamate methylesterase [Petroclostridium sp. X23]|uniref:protein-glutamate methylesterase/protein-glutamine glutaminase n=1 Tax=Petroclostridium sp. X23 TaxID=3045146 RepID=UPI0024AD0E78|nr:chemotaxis response regulator protein-glutamate methylesterase [Petroclostridium sp. X23]WHH60375.1 chemotaxis response regulator protein-glutamate methylesterase [Petroclostridium sp. X23]